MKEYTLCLYMLLSIPDETECSDASFFKQLHVVVPAESCVRFALKEKVTQKAGQL